MHESGFGYSVNQSNDLALLIDSLNGRLIPKLMAKVWAKPDNSDWGGQSKNQDD
jgi:hypothetical protein